MLAIIIPYYKFNFFEATLQSLANQTDQRFKVYIGDDASQENPLELLQSFQDKFDFQYKKFNNNLGSISLVKQWKRCVEMIDNEDWIMILGDDDVLSENLVASFYKNIETIVSKKIAVVRFSTIVINGNGEMLSVKYSHPEIEKSTDFLIRKFSKLTRSSLSEYVFQKKELIEIGFRDFPLAWHTDDMAMLEFSNFGNVFSMNEAIVFVRLSNFNITGNKSLMKLKNESTFKFCKVLLEEKNIHFSILHMKTIVRKLEVAYWNIPSRSNYFKLSKYYFKHIGLHNLICFNKRIIKNAIIFVLKKLNIFHTLKRLRL